MTCFENVLSLPGRGRSVRSTVRPKIQPGESAVLFDAPGPGCVKHWWLTCSKKERRGTLDPAHALRVRFFYDGEDAPRIDLPLTTLFGILFDRDVYEIHSEAVTVLPHNAFNCYLPIPYRRLRMEIQNTAERELVVWSMVDAHSYPPETPLTDQRLEVVARREHPAAAWGSMSLADLTGRGFLAGLILGVRVKDTSDHWFHCGGDLWLLDGEDGPSPLRGIGGEDFFNMSFGIFDRQTSWVGVPQLDRVGVDTPEGSACAGVMYRFFGPDPVCFEHSAAVSFGSRANDIESVVYAYRQPDPAPPAVLTVPTWDLLGPFACASREQFDRAEWPEGDRADWPAEQAGDFGQYLTANGPVTFSVPAKGFTEHGWCDVARHFKGRGRTNGGVQPCDVSAYAVGTLNASGEGEYELTVGYDDWLRLWVNGELVHDGRHDAGFATERIRSTLRAGENEIRVKLGNFDNLQWRLWAFSLTGRPVRHTAP